MNIDPITITTVKTINNFEILNIEVILNSRATLYVYLKNDDDVVLGEHITIEGDDYANWGSDDEYIFDYVKNYITSKYTRRL